MKKFIAIAAVAGLMSLTACGEKKAADTGNDVTANFAAPAGDNLATDNAAIIDNGAAPVVGNATDVAPVATDNSAAPAGNSAAPAGEKEKHHKAK